MTDDPPPESPADGPQGAARRRSKSPQAFRTISEVADELQIPQHVLRFWESRFPQIKPLKRGGGRRYYRPEDIALLRRIGDLLYVQGYTIKGVQRLLRDGGEGEGLDMAKDASADGPELDTAAELGMGEPGEGPAPAAPQLALFQKPEGRGRAAPRRKVAPKAEASAEPPDATQDADDAQAELARLRSLLREAAQDLASLASELRRLKGELG